MSALRSLLFNMAFFGWTALLCVGGIPLLAAPSSWVIAAQRFWARGVIGLLRLLVGTDYAVSGRENLPDGPFVIAAKHQSAWDTIIFFLLIDRPAYVLKKELLAIPLYGWYAGRAGHIAVDRKAGARALRCTGRPVVMRCSGRARVRASTRPMAKAMAIIEVPP